MGLNIMLCLNNRYLRYLIKEMVLYKTKEQIEIFEANDYNDAMGTLRRNTINTVLIDDDELIQYNEIKRKYPQILVLRLFSRYGNIEIHKNGDRFLQVPFTHEDLINSIFNIDDFIPFYNIACISYEMLTKNLDFCRSSVIMFEKYEKETYIHTCLEKKIINRDLDDLEEELKGLFFRTADEKLINISKIKVIKSKSNYYEVLLKNSDVIGIIEKNRIDELVKRINI